MKKIITIILSIILVFAIGITAYGATIEYTDNNGITQKISDFKDTKGHWAHDVILKWADYNIVAGNQGNFMPNNPIKRGDFCVILNRLLGLNTISYNYFYDLPYDAYYTESVLKCVAAEYISGTSATTVSPNGNATREQIAVILFRMLKLDSTGYQNVRKFSDDYNIGSWAREAVYTMRKYGYMTGDGSNNFNPRANITRAEVMQVLNNVAGVYIPKRDNAHQGDTFKSDFSKNVMIAGDKTLIDSNVKGDLIVTNSANNLDLNRSVVDGRLFVMSKLNINLKNSSINTIYLSSGKSVIYGALNSKVKNLYVSANASESTIDGIPDKIILEPGTRVQIGGTFYENITTEKKEYLGNDIKNDIASTQGFIVGGPRIATVQFKQNNSNIVSVENIKITEGASQVKEIGAIWLEQKEKANMIAPTYKNCSGRVVFDTLKFENTFDTTIGKINGTCAYRIYVKDEQGLYAYSNIQVLQSYDFDINISLSDINYPVSFMGEVELSGSNVPRVSSIYMVYDTDGNYSTEHKMLGMSKYRDAYSEIALDDSKYQRYTANIRSEVFYTKDGEYYEVPTNFGYIIEFSDGSNIREFPVISNAVPIGAKPINSLNIGNIIVKNDRIELTNNSLSTSYIGIQEVGFVHIESKFENIEKPTANAVGWEKNVCKTNIPINTSVTFDAYITIKDKEMNTFVCPYVKTSNGYFYGDVNKIKNNLNGDIEGYKIQRANALVMSENEALVILEVNSNVDLNSVISIGDIGAYSLNTIDGNNYNSRLYFVLRNLKKNTNYLLPIQITDSNGFRSNIVYLNIDTGNMVDVHYSNKKIINGKTFFTIESNMFTIDSLALKGVSTINSNVTANISNNTDIYLTTTNNISNVDTVTNFVYYIINGKAGTLGFEFTRNIKLY